MGFSADWLALREPADRAARDDALARRAAAAAGPAPLIVDLGCGTGATWRALTPFLPAAARWCFVDKDPELLAHAAAATGGPVDIVEADIADLATLPLTGATLVTASALLDLVTEDWIQGLARQLNVPFYAALTFNGTMIWEPEDPRDGDISAAFNRHQHGDKGLGRALGPEAGDRAREIFAGAGFEVQHADSPWRLGPELVALQRALTDGIANAAAEAGAPEAEAWGMHRREAAGRTRCIIGHVDILASPQKPGNETSHALS
jgi:SAM-dependent methyltransferase